MRRVALYLSPGFVGPVRPTFGGGCLCWSWTAPRGASARVDARGFVEDFPASFRRVLFEELVAGGDVKAAVLAALERASGDEEVPPP